VEATVSSRLGSFIRCRVPGKIIAASVSESGREVNVCSNDWNRAAVIAYSCYVFVILFRGKHMKSVEDLDVFKLCYQLH